MPLSLPIGLAIAAVVLGVLRLAVPHLPLRAARPVTRPGIALLLVGAVGLVLHCGSMFDRAQFQVIPGPAGYVRLVDAFGAVSVLLYALPAVLVLAALRHQNLPVLVMLLVALIAVGITMYDHGPLVAHLTAIAAAAVLLAATVALLVRPPGGRPARTPRPAGRDAGASDLV